MIEASLRERNTTDGFFLERLDAFMDKCLADIRAFSERESRPFEETRQYVAEWHARYIFRSRDTSVPSEQQPSRSDRIRTVLYDASRTLETLSETSGVQSFLLSVDPADPSDHGFLGGSLTGREFWRRLRNGGEGGANAFKTFCQKEMPISGPLSETSSLADMGDATKLPETLGKKTTAKNVKSELYDKIRTALRKESGFRLAEMRWTNPEKLDAYGVRLVGWPGDIPKQNPSSLKQSQNKQLLEALENGALKFEKTAAGHTKEGHKSHDLSDTMAEESAGVEEDFSWAYDADAEIGPNAPESGTSMTQFTQLSTRSGSTFSSSASTEDPKFEYRDYLNPSSELYSIKDGHDMKPPPVKRARTEEYESDS